MNIFTVCFFGHREIDKFSIAEEKLYDIICNLIRNKEYVDFLVGRNGEFDQIVASSVIRAKRNVFDANSSLVLALPYPTAEYLNNIDSFENYYDDIEIFNDNNTHFKSAFQKRNREMVDRSDLCVFYIEHEYGGAYQTYKYAMSRNKKIINIAE